MCAVGYYGTSTKCTACPKGTYQDTIAESSCKQCSGDKVTTATASTATSACSKLLFLIFKNFDAGQKDDASWHWIRNNICQ